MIGSIAAAIVAVWFYHTAGRSGRQPVSWAVAGLLVYFLVALLWTYLITPGVKDAATHSQSGLLILIARYAYIAAGLAAAVAFNVLVGKAKD